ncbi:MAG: hypothetical protein LRZ84_16170 [Desertifilum sp.]|nr:hypothetical protein [Desertifilum sp.]
MLVMLIDDRIIAPKTVCQGCLLADRSGQPRWRQGQLRCGHALQRPSPAQPIQYECQMGFRIACIE